MILTLSCFFPDYLGFFPDYLVFSVQTLSCVPPHAAPAHHAGLGLQTLKRGVEAGADSAAGWKALAELQYQNREWQDCFHTSVKGLEWSQRRRCHLRPISPRTSGAEVRLGPGCCEVGGGS